MKKGSGGRITSLTLEKKGGWEGGREREGVARRCDGKRCGSGSGGIRRADGWGPANWKAAESRVSQRRAVAAAPLLIAPGAAAGGGWIQRPWRRRWRRQLPSDPRQRLLDCSPYAGDMGTRQPLPSLGAPSPVHGTGATALPPAPRLCSVSLRKCPRFAPSPKPCQWLRGRLLLASFLPLSLGPGRRRRRRRRPELRGSPLPPPGLFFPAVSMKAFSPVRSVRKNSLSDHSLGISRSKTPVDDPMSLLYNMNDCYSKLKELVPSIPQNKKVSKMEILQHVIDYILDLQIALDSHPTIVSLHHQRPGQSQASRTPLTTLNTDISILSLQASEFPSELMSSDSKALCG